MPEFTVYLDNTTEEQFRAWLDDVRNTITFKTYYPADKLFPSYSVWYPPETPKKARYISLKANSAIPIKTAEGEALHFQDLDGVVMVKWLAVGVRLRVVFEYERLYLPVVFDFLEIVANDWENTQRDIWVFVNKWAKKYNLDVSRYPKPEGKVMPAVKTQKKQRRRLPTRKADLRKWAATYEFYDKHCGMEKRNARAFRIFFENYGGWDKQTVWMPQDDETLQAIIDFGRAGEIPKYDSIK